MKSFLSFSGLEISSKFMFGDVIFIWAPSPGSSGIDILITLDKVSSSWTRVNDTQYTVRNALLYEAINIRLRSLSLEQEESERTFKGTVPFSNKNISVVKIDRF